MSFFHETSFSKALFLMKLFSISSVSIALTVPDKRSRILEVVLVRRLVTWVLGIWSGEGMGKG
jgi:hypothetical protein